MPWVKLTDDWYDDPAIVVLDDHGVALWVQGLSWCARNLTDGAIPGAMVRRLTTHDDPQSVAARLVDLGLWSSTDTGFQVENYLRFQPSRADVLAQREKDRTRKADQRKRSQSSDRSPGGHQADSDQGPECPGPVPGPDVPTVVVSQSDLVSATTDGSHEGLKAEVWSQIAAWKAEDKGKVGNARWLASVRRNQPTDEHPDGGTFDSQADRLLSEYPDLSGRELAEALVGRLSRRSLAMRRAS